MSRNIKFKAWNIEEQIMHDVAFPSWNGCIEVWQDNKPQTTTQYLSMHGEEDEGVLLEFTGLLDKDGLEIYEGHIVESVYNGKFNVKIGINPHTGVSGTYLESADKDDDMTYMITPVTKFKVIGNIYQEEHKHLRGEQYGKGANYI